MSSGSQWYQTDSLAIASAKYAFPREKKKTTNPYFGVGEGKKKINQATSNGKYSSFTSILQTEDLLL